MYYQPIELKIFLKQLNYYIPNNVYIGILNNIGTWLFYKFKNIILRLTCYY